MATFIALSLFGLGVISMIFSSKYEVQAQKDGLIQTL